MDTYEVHGKLHIVKTWTDEWPCPMCNSGSICWGHGRDEPRAYRVEAESADAAPWAAIVAIHRETHDAGEVELWYWYGEPKVTNLSAIGRDKAALEAWNAGKPIRDTTAPQPAPDQH